MSTLSDDQCLLLQKPISAKAVQEQTITNPIYVIERFNEVFGVGQWQLRSDIIGPGIIRTCFKVTDYGIHYESADVDAIIKIGSCMGIGSDVYKGITAEDSQKQWDKKIKPFVRDAVNDLTDCQTVKHLTELKGDLPSYVLESREFIDAAKARYDELTGNKPTQAPESDQQQKAGPVSQPEEITAPVEPNRPLLENPTVILQNGNPVNVQKFIDAANDPELVNSTLTWLRRKEEEGYNVKTWLTILNDKAITVLNLTFNSKEARYYVYAADKAQTQPA